MCVLTLICSRCQCTPLAIRERISRGVVIQEEESHTRVFFHYDFPSSSLRCPLCFLPYDNAHLFTYFVRSQEPCLVLFMLCNKPEVYSKVSVFHCEVVITKQNARETAHHTARVPRHENIYAAVRQKTRRLASLATLTGSLSLVSLSSTPAPRVAPRQGLSAWMWPFFGVSGTAFPAASENNSRGDVSQAVRTKQNAHSTTNASRVLSSCHGHASADPLGMLSAQTQAEPFAADPFTLAFYPRIRFENIFAIIILVIAKKMK